MAGTANAGATTGTNRGEGGIQDQVHEKANEVRDQASEQVRKAGGQARDRAREQGKDGPARIADQVAERAERAGSWMKESDAERILGDVEDFARSNPWAVAAGGLALGFVASRVLKASSSRRYEDRDAARRLPPAGGTTAGGDEVPYTREPRAIPVDADGPVGTPVVDEPRTIPTGPPRSRTGAPLDDPVRTSSHGGGL